MYLNHEDCSPVCHNIIHIATSEKDGINYV